VIIAGGMLSLIFLLMAGISQEIMILENSVVRNLEIKNAKPNKVLVFVINTD
jgi:hypothetical protein